MAKATQQNFRDLKSLAYCNIKAYSITIFKAPLLPKYWLFCPYLTWMLSPSVYNYMFHTPFELLLAASWKSVFLLAICSRNLTFLYHIPQNSSGLCPLPDSKASLICLGICYRNASLLGNTISINFF